MTAKTVIQLDDIARYARGHCRDDTQRLACPDILRRDLAKARGLIDRAEILDLEVFIGGNRHHHGAPALGGHVLRDQPCRPPTGFGAQSGNAPGRIGDLPFRPARAKRRRDQHDRITRLDQRTRGRVQQRAFKQRIGKPATPAGGRRLKKGGRAACRHAFGLDAGRAILQPAGQETPRPHVIPRGQQGGRRRFPRAHAHAGIGHGADRQLHGALVLTDGGFKNGQVNQPFGPA